MSNSSSPTEAERRNGHAAHAHTADTPVFTPPDCITLKLDPIHVQLLREHIAMAGMAVDAAAGCIRGNVSEPAYKYYADGLQSSFEGLAGLLEAEFCV